MDVNKHIEYWRTNAQEDWDAAIVLIGKKHYRHAMFFIHLSLEKTLKSAVVAATGEMPPRSHDLLRLAAMAGLAPNEDRSRKLARINRFCMEGRYPDNWIAPPDTEESTEIVEIARELLEWSTKQFENE
jgi:HEPN domain-containing protein